MKKVFDFITYIILLIISIITVFPIIYSICGSFKTTQELMTSRGLIPKEFVFDNYVYAWTNIDFPRYAINSLVVAMVVVIFSVVTATMSAYIFSRKDFKGKNVLRGMYLASMFIAIGPAALYPIYNVLVRMGANENLWGIILPQIGGQVTNIFLAESYLKGIPKSFDEAAIMDGCSPFRIYVKVILPLMLPIMAVIALLVFRGSWNSYLLPMIITTGRPQLKTLTVAVTALKSSGGMATMWSVMLAATNITILPIVLVYIICNKQFVDGLTLGGIKE